MYWTKKSESFKAFKALDTPSFWSNACKNQLIKTIYGKMYETKINPTIGPLHLR